MNVRQRRYNPDVAERVSAERLLELRVKMLAAAARWEAMRPPDELGQGSTHRLSVEQWQALDEAIAAWEAFREAQEKEDNV